MFDYLQKNKTLFIVLLFFIYLYISTLYPGIGGRINYGDSVKWQYLWIVGGTPHSTGYPLFLFLTQLFGKMLTFLEVPYRITVISTISALGTLYVLYHISTKIINNKYAHYLPLFFLGGSYPFWAEATEAEVYTLNAFFITLIIYFALLFYQTKKLKYYFILISIYALSFGNHLTMIFLLPALLFIIYKTEQENVFQKRNILITLLIFFLGASQYLYLLYLSYYSQTPYLEFIGNNASIQHWLSYIMGGEFKTELGGNKTFNDLYFRAIPNFLTALWNSFGLLIIISFVFFKKNTFNDKGLKNNIPILFLILVAFFELGNALTYNIKDIVVYYIPTFLIFSLLLAKFIDLIPSQKKQNTLIAILYITSIFLIAHQYTLLEIKNNPYKNIKKLFNRIPSDSLLYIPLHNFYGYDGHDGAGHNGYDGYEALKYAQEVDYKQKNIKYVSHITVPSATGKHINECETFFTRMDANLSYDVINSDISIANIQDIYIPCSFGNLVPCKYFNTEQLIKARSLTELITNNKNDLIVIAAQDEASFGLDKTTLKTLLSYGIHLNKLKFRGSYVGVIYRGKVIFEKIDNRKKIEIKNSTLMSLGIDRIISAGKHNGDTSSIYYEGTDLSLHKRGLNIALIKENTILTLNVDTYNTVRVRPLLLRAIKK